MQAVTTNIFVITSDLQDQSRIVPQLAGVSAQIQIQHLTNISVDHSHYTNQVSTQAFSNNHY
jgi:predicted RNA-binding protein with PIN domain